MQKAREGEIIAAYQAWDGEGNAEMFAKSQGISKQTLYSLLRKHDVPTKRVSQILQTSGEGMDAMIDEVARAALTHILEENRQVHRLEDRVDELERALREAGVDPDSV